MTAVRTSTKKSIDSVKMRKTIVFITALLAFGFFIPISYAQTTGVIFQDNFDGHPDWTRQQLLFPQNDVCYSGDCDVPAGWDSYYNGCSFCGSDPGHNTLNLNSDNPRGGSGKSLTFWDESCYEGFGDSTGELGKDLGKNYQELYIRYYIKFAPGYKWLPNVTPQHKLGHVWYYTGIGTPYSFFSDNRPIFVLGLVLCQDLFKFLTLEKC